MLVVIFLLLAICSLLIAANKVKPALFLFFCLFVLGCVWFNHHMTSSLAIHL